MDPLTTVEPADRETLEEAREAEDAAQALPTGPGRRRAWEWETLGTDGRISWVKICRLSLHHLVVVPPLSLSLPHPEELRE